MVFMGYFKDMRRLSRIKSPEDVKPEDVKIWLNAKRRRAKIRSFARAIWAAIMGICTIVAAVFSVLSFFK